LVKAWQLRKLPSADHPFGIFVGEDRAVIVTGIGKINMAGAMAYVMAIFNKPQSPVLINLGIAGQRKEILGTPCLGHKIVDSESGRCFYPQMPFSVPCKTYTVVTTNQPNNDYPAGEMLEMEAAGFYEMAVKFSVSELAHVIKVISDNTQSPIANINETLVERWIAECVPLIDSLLEPLTNLRQQVVVTTGDDYHELLEALHFTVSRSLKLKALLQRWKILKGNEAMTWQTANVRNAKELLNWMEQELDSIDFCL